MDNEEKIGKTKQCLREVMDSLETLICRELDEKIKTTLISGCPI